MSDEVQRFSVTSGRVVGVLAVATAAGVVVATVLDAQGRPSYLTIALAVFFGAAAWAAMLRPRVELDESRLVLRNMLETVALPLEAIESVAVRQVLVVFAGDKRYTSSAVGRTRRQLHRDGRPTSSPGGMMGILPALPSTPEKPETAKSSYGLFVEERIRSRVSDALARQGVKARSPEQARFTDGIERRPAYVELVVLAGSLLAFVALLFV